MIYILFGLAVLAAFVLAPPRWPAGSTAGRADPSRGDAIRR